MHAAAVPETIAPQAPFARLGGDAASGTCPARRRRATHGPGAIRSNRSVEGMPCITAD
jgi:hypothetical protein